MSSVTDPAWLTLSLTAFFAAGLTPIVLIGLFVHQRQRLGPVGLVGLLLSVAGALVYFGFQFDVCFVWPVLAQGTPGLLRVDGPMFHSPALGFVHFWTGPVASVGVLLFGIATYRARVFTRVSAVGFLFGTILTQGVLFLPLILRFIGAIPAAVGLAPTGLRQFRGRWPNPLQSQAGLCRRSGRPLGGSFRWVRSQLILCGFFSPDGLQVSRLAKALLKEAPMPWRSLSVIPVPAPHWCNRSDGPRHGPAGLRGRQGTGNRRTSERGHGGRTES